jgi:predicted O-methyltransferase YrrM
MRDSVETQCVSQVWLCFKRFTVPDAFAATPVWRAGFSAALKEAKKNVCLQSVLEGPAPADYAVPDREEYQKQFPELSLRGSRIGSCGAQNSRFDFPRGKRSVTNWDYPMSSHCSLFSQHEALGSWYAPVMLDPETIFCRARQPSTVNNVLRVLEALEPDSYSIYVSAYLKEGREKFGADWNYLDILNVLVACSELIQPLAYLEIGVRRGRSIAMVASMTPKADLYGFDSWVPDYAGMENPGPEFVESELRKIGASGKIEFVSGDSHQTLPKFFAKHPELKLDLVTVDGDHSDEGARQDLLSVLPKIARGGAVVFDDVSHPLHPNLYQVWSNALQDCGLRFVSGAYAALGYGVAVAVRN